MNARRIIFSLGAAAALTAAPVAPAQAATGLAMWPLMLVSIYPKLDLQCNQAPSTATSAKFSDKITALLGGQPSSLERIRMQQAGSQTRSAQTALASGTPAEAGYTPSAPAMPAGIGCRDFVSATPRLTAMTAQPSRAVLSPDDFLASKRLAVQHTDFDSAWDRVRSHALSYRRVIELTGISASPVNEQMLLAVNSWVNRKVRYVDDQAQYGRADYWGTAASTLKRAQGDCEDIAIVKMQMLAALGVPQDKMFLTIARDQVRGGDHALLIVNFNGNYRLLDDSTDTILDGRQPNDYMPIMSFSANHKWLHGF